jgi:DNA-binding HxlR family transcriptional regulator
VGISLSFHRKFTLIGDDWLHAVL